MRTGYELQSLEEETDDELRDAEERISIPVHVDLHVT